MYGNVVNIPTFGANLNLSPTEALLPTRSPPQALTGFGYRQLQL